MLLSVDCCDQDGNTFFQETTTDEKFMKANKTGVPGAKNARMSLLCAICFIAGFGFSVLASCDLI